jgi:probable HAF family extracellular repeat protein
MRTPKLICCAGVLLLACESTTQPSAGDGVMMQHNVVRSVAMTDLGTLPGGRTSIATAINAQNDVVGWAETAGGDIHAVLWRDGQVTDLGTLGGTFSQAHAINNQGMVVGRSTTSGGLESRQSAFLWQAGRMINIGLPSGATESVGFGINGRGTVAIYTDAGLATWKEGKWTMLATPLRGTGCSVVGIDNADGVSGYCQIGSRIRSFIWEHGLPRDVGGAAGWDVAVTAISPSGVVAGFYSNGTGGSRPFLVRHGRFLDLITEGANPTFTPAAAIAEGRAAGGIVTGDRNQHAALWRSGLVLDLGTLPGGSDSYAGGMNSSGHVVGWSGNASGASHAVLWTVH